MVIIDALDVLCTQLMHDLFAIAKFLLVTVYFLVVNLHHDHLDTTFELSHILTLNDIFLTSYLK